MAPHYLVVAILILVSNEAGGEGCVEGDVRLVGRDSLFEGRVEICRGGNWGRVCTDYWNGDIAIVVCRQLGFSDQGARYTWEEPGTSPTLLDRVQCNGREERLALCNSKSKNINCVYDHDAGVKCEGIKTQVSHNGRSVNVTWNIPDPNVHHVMLNLSHAENTLGNQIVHSSVVTLSRCEAYFEYDSLLPAQNYTVCVGQSTCTSILTPIETPPRSSETDSSTPCSSIEGILGFIIAVFVFLLIVAGVGLAYPRCRRGQETFHKVLDCNVYHLASSEVHSQQPFTQQRGENGARSGQDVREAADQHYAELDPIPGKPSHGSSNIPSQQAMDNIVAQHYEMSPATPVESRNHEEPVVENEEVSHLEY